MIKMKHLENSLQYVISGKTHFQIAERFQIARQRGKIKFTMKTKSMQNLFDFDLVS